MTEPMTEEAAAQDFWAWSLAVYDRASVKDTLLVLQDRYQQNVNLLLWSIWAARKGWRLAPEQVVQIVAAVEDFTLGGVERLRELRRYFSVPKKGFPYDAIIAIRADLLRLELETERLIQHRLAALTVELGGERVEEDAPDASASARVHFDSIGPRLEKPVILVDEQGPGSPALLFESLLALTVSEETE